MRIRWRLYRRNHTLGRRHLVLVIVAAAGFWIAVSLYHGLGTDAQLQRQLDHLQGQTQSLTSQVQAQRVELQTAGSPAAQSELSRAEGLVEPGEKVYAIESPVKAAGPGAIQRAAEEVGQTALGLAQEFLVPPAPSS